MRSAVRASVHRDASRTTPRTELERGVIALEGLEKNFDIPNLDGDGEFPNLVEAAIIFNPPGAYFPGAGQNIIQVEAIRAEADIEGRGALAILSWHRATGKLV